MHQRTDLILINLNFLLFLFGFGNRRDVFDFLRRLIPILFFHVSALCLKN